MSNHSMNTSLRSRAAVVVLLLVLGSGCSSDDAPSRKSLSWNDIDIGGIRLRTDRAELQSKFRSLRCERKGFETYLCTWSPKARSGPFSGIDKVTLTFERDSLQRIRLSYKEMFDVDYRKFDKEIRRKYAGRQTEGGLDTVDCEWRYESVLVNLSPNRRQHWTGTFYVFSPTLEFQERNVGTP